MNLYSGLDGGGALVGTIPLPAASIFSPAGLFEGTPFKSAVFTGNADALVFDNITLGGSLVIPEPGSALSDGQRDGWDGTDPEDIHESICQAFNFWVAAPSDGGFIEATDPRFGLNSLTTDTSTGLQWLDLNVSAGRSFTDVASQFGPSGDFAGYRYATPVEIGNLFNSFGLLREIDPGTNTSTFFSLFGSTSSQAGNPEVFGWASDALTAQYNIYGLDFSFSSGGPKYNVLLGDSLNENPTLVFPSTGSWLVAVPEPAPFALLALGLAGLVIRGRKPTRLRC